MDNPDRDKDISMLLEEHEFYGNRRGSPSPSGVSMKSDVSMEPPTNFSGGVSSPLHRFTQPWMVVPMDSKFYGNRPGSPSPSGVSMKSARSMKPPANFSGGVSSPLHRCAV
ncbi:uncharacterized protein Hap1MRO34_014882 [Clarias gariepinus]